MRRIQFVGNGISVCTAILTVIAILVHEIMYPPMNTISDPLFALYNIYNEPFFQVLAFGIVLTVALIIAIPFTFFVVSFLKFMQRSTFSFPAAACLLFGKLALLTLVFYGMPVDEILSDSRMSDSRGISSKAVVLSLVSLLIAFLLWLGQLRKIKREGEKGPELDQTIK